MWLNGAKEIVNFVRWPCTAIYIPNTATNYVNEDHFYTLLKDHVACHLFIYSGGFVMLNGVLRDLENNDRIN